MSEVHPKTGVYFITKVVRKEEFRKIRKEVVGDDPVESFQLKRATIGNERNPTILGGIGP